MQWLLRLALLLEVVEANKRITVMDLDMERFRETINRFPNIAVLMHDGRAEVTAFQPWLYAIAQTVPQLRFARVNVSAYWPVAKTFRVAAVPAIKMFQREQEPGKRITDYTGPLEFDPLLGWCEAVLAGTEHELSQAGFEPPTPKADEIRAAKQKQRSAGGAGVSGDDGMPTGSVPDSVRKMAQTMVKETRLNRILESKGPEMAKRYQGRVSHVYQKLVQDEGIDLANSFLVQDANRRARDQVMEEVLTGAPHDIIDEINREVNLGSKGYDSVQSVSPEDL